MITPTIARQAGPRLLTLGTGEASQAMQIKQDLYQPGVYEGVEAFIYHKLPHCSNSRLKELAISGKHLEAALKKPKELNTSSVRMGAALDDMLLDPANWLKWTTLNAGEKFNSGAGLAKKKGHIARMGETHYNRHHLNAKEFETVRGMQAAIEAHEDAADLLLGHTQYSKSQITLIFRWLDVLFKGRPDRLILSDTIQTGIDLKTIDDAREHNIVRRILDLGYHRQAVLYMIGCQVLGIPVKEFKFVFVENSAPYNVEIVQLSPEFIELAVRELEPLVKRYAYCTQNNYYPGYSSQALELSPPAWALSTDFDEKYLSDLPKTFSKAA